ncbi:MULTISPECIES: hypothetical protein [Calothrix]|uniref:Glycosyltransferase RgtA/B/C/D-like domain-containing protein n=2 Tax=Calothrix TaxID=1186 RepID=A0ABR8A7Y4_9CYAN|nr:MULTISPECIES: hypothetical protein [Calothrix]MBD2196107.1 hypothetical protein [Calothrix parietina FACHB-288]MBD2224758.1 hypothetical protein [Calothrix anomala FACHB-343]
MNVFLNKITQNSHSFSNTVTIFFFLIGLPAILNHAMWRDELNVWLIVRDSQSLSELFYNIHYEGHPFVWYICLAILKQIINNPIIMQIFHLCLATTSVYLFTRYSPFSYLQKVLYCLGYFPLYEYLLISRNYAIGLLFCLLFCTLYASRKQTYLKLSIVLFFLANSNAYCLVLSIVLTTTLVLDYILQKPLNQIILAKKIDIVFSFLIACSGIILSLIQLIPPQDSKLAGGLSGFVLNFNFNHLIKTLIRVWNSYIIILVPGESQQISLIVFSLISLAFIGFFAVLFIRKPIIFFLYTFGTIAILAFTYVKFLGAPRHYGHLYTLLIVCLWLSKYYSKSSLFLQVFRPHLRTYIIKAIKWTKPYHPLVIMFMLYAQMLGGIFTFSRDIILPFSASRETATYLKAEYKDKLKDVFIIGSPDYTMSPIAGYINRKIYYPEIQRLGSFVLFTTQRQEVDHAAILNQLSQIIKTQSEPILLILNKQLEANNSQLKITPVKEFTRAFNSDERYHLYSVSQTS